MRFIFNCVSVLGDMRAVCASRVCRGRKNVSGLLGLVTVICLTWDPNPGFQPEQGMPLTLIHLSIHVSQGLKKKSRSMEISQHLLLEFINKERTVPKVHASVRNKERKSFARPTWLSAIKLACNFCIRLLVVGNQVFWSYSLSKWPRSRIFLWL